MYLLDTNVISDANRPGYAPRVISWMRVQREDDLFISVMSLGEIARGIERLPAARRRSELERWLSGLRSNYSDRLLVIDAEIAMLWGRMRLRYERGGKSPPITDLMIGATAIRHGLTVVTRNVSDFEPFNVPIINPWDGENGA